MARRINPYTVVRKIHLYSGLSLMGFVLMYFVSGYIMTHYSWFETPRPEKIEKTHVYHPPSGLSPGELAFRIQEEFELNGQVEEPQIHRDSSMSFFYGRPGMEYEVKWVPNEQQLHITQNPGNLMQVANSFHRIHGYGGGWIYDLYVLMMDLTSLSMLVFAITGIYLWLRLIKYKWLGYLILGSSIVYTFAVIAQLMA